MMNLHIWQKAWGEEAQYQTCSVVDSLWVNGKGRTGRILCSKMREAEQVQS